MKTLPTILLALIGAISATTTWGAPAGADSIRPGHNLYEDAPTTAGVAIGEQISSLTFRESSGEAAHLVRVWRFSRSSALQLKGSSTAKSTKLELAQE